MLPTFVLCLSALLFHLDVRGVVVDAQSGEPLSRVVVQLGESSRHLLTDSHGAFDLGSLPPGDYSLKAFTVGYRLLQTRVHLAPGAPVDPGWNKVVENSKATLNL